MIATNSGSRPGEIEPDPIRWVKIRSGEGSDRPVGPLAEVLLEDGVIDEAASLRDITPLRERILGLRPDPAFVSFSGFRRRGKPATERKALSDYRRAKQWLKANWRYRLWAEVRDAHEGSTMIVGLGRPLRRAWLCMAVIELAGPEYVPGMEVCRGLARPGGYTMKDIGRFAHRERRSQYRKITERLVKYGVLHAVRRKGAQVQYRYTGRLSSRWFERLGDRYARTEIRSLIREARESLLMNGGDRWSNRGWSEVGTAFGPGMSLVGSQPPDWYAAALGDALSFGLGLLWVALDTPPAGKLSSGRLRPAAWDPETLVAWTQQEFHADLNSLCDISACVRGERWRGTGASKERRIHPAAELRRWAETASRIGTRSILVADLVRATGLDIPAKAFGAVDEFEHPPVSIRERFQRLAPLEPQ